MGDIAAAAATVLAERVYPNPRPETPRVIDVAAHAAAAATTETCDDDPQFSTEGAVGVRVGAASVCMDWVDKDLLGDVAVGA